MLRAMATAYLVDAVRSPIGRRNGSLSEIRADELACSVAALGGGAVHQHLLGYRDSGMMGTEANGHPECFWQADVEEATRRLVEIAREARPSAIVSYDENGNYGEDAAHRRHGRQIRGMLRHPRPLHQLMLRFCRG